MEDLGETGFSDGFPMGFLHRIFPKKTQPIHWMVYGWKKGNISKMNQNSDFCWMMMDVHPP